MKTKLVALGLTGELADRILDIFDSHQRTVQRLSKPKGKVAFHDNIREIETLSRTLHEKLSGLSLAEKQLIDDGCYPKIFTLKGGLNLLSLSCQKVGKMNFRFSRRSPFLLDLTINLWKLLEANGLPVKIYKSNILCKILTTLHPLPVSGLSDDEIDELPDDLWAFHLLREAKKRMKV